MLSKRLLRTGTLVLAISATGFLFAHPASARVQFGVRAGVVVDDSDPFVGLEVLVPLSPANLDFNPNVEFVDSGSRDRVSFNADFHYDFRNERTYTLWAGAGAALIHTDAPRGFDSSNDAGLNLLGGIGWKYSDMTPYAQIKIVVANKSSLFAGVGIRF